MSEARLDQLVKGAPLPDKILPAVPTSGVITSPPSLSPFQLSDPLAHLPSSPPQIYLNLLILEASLRAQYLELRARRRQYTFFLTILGLWNIGFGYALFLAPREDGSGVGGSVYWVVEVIYKVCLMGGIVTGILVWGTGQWERGIRWPRRWVGITNRGLRGFNCKIVVVKGPWWKEWLSILSAVFSYGLFLSNDGSSYRYVDRNLQSETEKGSKPGLPNIHEDDPPLSTYEEDLSPGGDVIKLLLLPKPFSPAFRENWDLYRTEYWERENERRRLLLTRLRIQDKKLAKQKPGPSFFSRFRFRAAPRDVEKSHHSHHSHSHHSHSHSQHKHGAGAGTGGAEKRLRSPSIRSSSHSRQSSRSSTPTPEFEDQTTTATLARRSSNASTSSASSSLRKKKPSSSSSSSALRAQKLTPSNQQPGRASSAGLATATAAAAAAGKRSSLVRGNSFSSTDGSRPTTPADAESVRSVGMGGTGGSPGVRK